MSQATCSFLVSLEEFKDTLIERARKGGLTLPDDKSKIHVGYEMPSPTFGNMVIASSNTTCPIGIKLWWYVP